MEIQAERARRAREVEARRLATDGDEIRARCNTLAGFVRQAWRELEPSRPYIHGWHIDAICLHLEAITYGRYLQIGRSNRLLINVPPGTMKSLLVSVFWPAWEWGPAGRPATRYIATSYSETYAKRDSRRMRDLIGSEWYQSLWGQTVSLTRSGETSFANAATGFREGMPFASLTGGRGDRVIIDDPHSTETAESELDRERVTRIFRESVTTRLNDPEQSAIVVIMQRLHEQDVSGQAIALGLGYDHLMLPMEFEPSRRCVTALGWSDPRTTDGELLFPERFPRAVIDRDKIPLGSYAIAGQFQQRPAPREGGMFQRRWFPVWLAAPSCTKYVRKWDLAATAETQGRDPDWTVGLLMGTGPLAYFILDVVRFRGSAADVEASIINTASQDAANYGDVHIHLSQDPGQAGKSQVAYLTRALAGYVVSADPETGKKEVRAAPFASQAEAGNVVLVAGPWNEAFLSEVEVFPAGRHDDQVDAAAGAFDQLVRVPKHQFAFAR